MSASGDIRFSFYPGAKMPCVVFGRRRGIREHTAKASERPQGPISVRKAADRYLPAGTGAVGRRADGESHLQALRRAGNA